MTLRKTLVASFLLTTVVFGSVLIAVENTAPAATTAPAPTVATAPTVAPTATASPTAKSDPCAAIIQACTAAGFRKGGANEGKGLLQHCVHPIKSGQVITGVTVTAEAIQACKQPNKRH